jgi:hypothetical protein
MKREDKTTEFHGEKESNLIKTPFSFSVYTITQPPMYMGVK